MAPMVILMMVSHTSVAFCGGHLPKPMHNMCDMALKSDQEYCSNTGAFCTGRRREGEEKGREGRERGGGEGREGDESLDL